MDTYNNNIIKQLCHESTMYIILHCKQLVQHGRWRGMQIGAGGRAVPVPFGGGGAFERQVVPRLRGGCARWGREMRAVRRGSSVGR